MPFIGFVSTYIATFPGEASDDRVKNLTFNLTAVFISDL